MKVNAFKNIDVEFEAEVSLDDCINEMLEIADKEANRVRISAVDGATKILEKVSPAVLGMFTDSKVLADVKNKLRERLAAWMEVLTPATPDLLGACKALVDSYDMMRKGLDLPEAEEGSPVALARLAIAKAEGGAA